MSKGFRHEAKWIGLEIEVCIQFRASLRPSLANPCGTGWQPSWRARKSSGLHSGVLAISVFSGSLNQSNNEGNSGQRGVVNRDQFIGGHKLARLWLISSRFARLLATHPVQQKIELSLAKKAEEVEFTFFACFGFERDKWDTDTYSMGLSLSLDSPTLSSCEHTKG